MAIKQAVKADFNFGDMGVYVAGGGIPEGDYALTYDVMYEPATENYTPKVARLGVMLTAHPLAGGEPKTKFLSMGSDVHESFGPNPNTGKGISPLANGKGKTTMSQSTNWAIHLKSLYDSGLPLGVFTNDVSVLDGVHVHIVAQNEPEERKGFKAKAKTGDMEQAEEPRRAGTIPVVTEIKEGGAPWEGGGGLPSEQPAAPAAKPNGKAAPVNKTAQLAKQAAVQQAAAAGESPSEEELLEAAVAGVTTVLEKNPNGCSTLILRTKTFTAVKEAFDEDIANAVINTFFGSDDDLNNVLTHVDYVAANKKVSPKG